MHIAAEQFQDGDIAVAACTADSEDGFFGELRNAYTLLLENWGWTFTRS
jgi:hypothetical protein